MENIMNGKSCSLNEFNMLTMDELKNIVSNLNSKKCSVDSVTVDVLKKCFDVCGDGLLNIVNTSLRVGGVPDAWKCSTVTPVPKITDPTNPSHLRPINMLPIYEKILEIAVHKQISQYFETNELLYKYQSGFRKNMSTEDALQLVISNWRNYLNNKNIVGAVMLDLKRAFETIDRKILLDKLRVYGIGNTVLRWFESYLTNRKQKTKIGQYISDVIDNNIGVPQGSVLGPLLFIIYMNDLSNVTKDVSINLFADDTLVYVNGKNVTYVCDVLNRELKNMSIWFAVNKLKLNVSKTTAIVIANSKITIERNFLLNPTASIIIDNENVPFSDNVKYLGLLIDSCLTFDEHVNYVAKKVSKKIGYLNRISNFLTPWTKQMVYKTIISPHFEYCSSLLFNTSQKNFDVLQKLQNRGMRSILKCHPRTPREIMIKTLCWLTVKQRVAYRVLLFLYKVYKGNAPNYLREQVKTNSEVHTHNTRFCNKFHLPQQNNSKSQKSIFINGVKLFNKVPDEVKNNVCKNKFKYYISDFVKEEYRL
jgi:hypothetical protein